ncbi:MAG: BON domain-containing protein [Hyphomicrobiaceae bacterium]
MKCNPWRWLWGLIPILMLGWIAVLAEREQIEADLTSRAQLVLQRSDLNWAKVQFDGRDAIVYGKALADDDRAKATQAMLDTFGVRIAEDRSSLLEKVAQFEWSAIKRDGRIRIDGLVPSDQARSDVLGMVKANFPSIEVDDRTKLARGAPPIDVWLGGVGFGLKQLASLKEGRVDLENTSMSVSGDAIDGANYRRVRQALSGRLPQGIRLKSESVRPPRAQPYVWSVRRRGKEIVLAGYVPSDSVREQILRAARRIGGDANVIDRMEPAAGAPQNFVGAATALLQQIAVLDDGSVTLRDDNGTLTGTADTAKVADEIQSAIKTGALASYSVTGKIGHREPAVRTISPYVTQAEVSGNGIELTGYVPDDGARVALVAMAKRLFPDRGIVDRLEIGAGQPPGWANCMEAGLDAVRRLGAGRAEITGRRLSVRGKTDNEALAQALPGEVRSVLSSACDADVQIALDLDMIRAREEERRRAEAAAQQPSVDTNDTAKEQAALAAKLALAAEAERRRAEAEARKRAEQDRLRAEAAAQAQAEEDRRRAEAAAQAQARGRSPACRSSGSGASRGSTPPCGGSGSGASRGSTPACGS